MKKTTILILIIIYLGSILVVGIFGMINSPYQEIKPIESIIPTSITLNSGESIAVRKKESEPNSYYTTITNFSIPENQEGMIIILNYELKPADATNKELDISIMHTNSSLPIDEVVVIDNGRILIKSPASITIRYQEKNRPNGAVMFFYIYVL